VYLASTECIAMNDASHIEQWCVTRTEPDSFGSTSAAVRSILDANVSNQGPVS